MRKAVIILPTYNEVHNVEKIIPLIFQETEKILNWEIHVVVVDSDSPDGTQNAVTKLIRTYRRLHLIRMKKEGLGRAYTLGFRVAEELLNPYLFFEMDADLSHDPKSIPQFIREIESGADLVIGSRYIKGGSIPKDWGIHRKIFSIVGNLVVRFGFMHLRITDWTDGYRAIKSWIIKQAENKIKNYSGYVFQIALLDSAIKMKARIREIPVQFSERRSGKSKINAPHYMITIFLYIFQHSSFIKFVIVGGLGFILDFGLSYVLIEKKHMLIWVATLISTETAIISNFILNNFWSFSHKKIANKVSAYFPSFIKFNVVSSGSIGIQTLGVQLASMIFGRKLWYVYKFLIIVFVIIPYSYFFYNRFIWKEK